MAPTTTEPGNQRTDPLRTRTLLEGARRGEEQSRRSLFSAHRDYLGYVLSTLAVPHAGLDVDAILDATAVRAWAHVETFEYHGVGSLRRWLREIAMSAFLDALRREPVVPTSSAAADPEASDHGAAQRALALRLFAGLARLTPEDRDVVIMHELEGLTWEEISELEGRPRTTVRRDCERASERLRAWMC